MSIFPKDCFRKVSVFYSCWFDEGYITCCVSLQRAAEPALGDVGGSFAGLCLTRVMRYSSWSHRQCDGVSTVDTCSRQSTEALGCISCYVKVTRTFLVVVHRQVQLVDLCSARRHGWFCWFRRISRCVSLDCRQAQGLWLWLRFHRCSSWTRLW